MTSENTIFIKEIKTPIGELILGSFDGKLCLCDWKYRKMRNSIDNRLKKGLDAIFIEKETEVITKAEAQINEYLDKKREEFDLDLLFVGTEFQKNVWHQLLTIPYGKRVSYLELAQKIGNKSAVRAVASANGANAISLFVPCHRIIGSNGKLVGYAGGLLVKQKLLKLENSSEQLLLSFD